MIFLYDTLRFLKIFYSFWGFPPDRRAGAPEQLATEYNPVARLKLLFCYRSVAPVTERTLFGCGVVRSATRLKQVQFPGKRK